MSGSTQTMSKEFLELVRAIGEAKSKQEEDKIISNEIRVLKSRMAEKDISKKKMKEYIIRMLYTEMLGHDASFGHINAVNMTHHTKLLEKRVGYLAVGLCLHEDHELMILLVNTIQRDLKSSNFLEVCAALNSVCRLMNSETIPAVLPIVVDLLTHQQELVRKKAVMALHRFYTKSPISVSHLQDKFRRALCDKDPSVMAASLCIFHDLIKDDPLPYKDLIPSFVSILKQITEHRLSRDFDYHRIPAPWIQIKILKVIALLGADDQTASEGTYEILHEVMKRSDTGINAGYAVVYETVRTISSIYPNTPLLEAAASAISRFITSDNHNLKYLGIKALAGIVSVDRKYAAEHQMVVIDCMEDPDETLKRKTLDLLFKITTSNNVTVIVEKMTQYLRVATDVHLRTELVSRITQLAERYAPSNEWFLSTMNTVFELGGDLVQEETAHNLMRLIAEGSGEDEDADTMLKISAVSTYASLLDSPNIPDILLEVIAWVVGEYAYLCEELSEEDILDALCDVLDRQQNDKNTRGWIVSAMAKACARIGECPPQVAEVLEQYSQSQSVDLQQRVCEIRELCKKQETLANVMPLDGSCEDLEVDEDLSFLEGFVQRARALGAKEYMTAEEREDFDVMPEIAGLSVKHDDGSGLKIEAYAQPQVGNRFVNNPDAEANLTLQEEPEQKKEGLQTKGVARKWGPKGYNDGSKSATSSPAAPEPTPVAAAPAAAPADEPDTSAAVQQGKPAGSWGRKEAAPTPAAPVTEKERLAASLFGTGPAPAAEPARSTRARPAPKNSVRKPASAPRDKYAGQSSATGSGSGDLFAGTTTRSQTGSAPAPAPQKQEDNLLDLGFGDPTPAPAATSAPAPSNPAPLVDLMSMDIEPSQSSTPVIPAVDLLGGGLDLMGGPSGSGPVLTPDPGQPALGTGNYDAFRQTGVGGPSPSTPTGGSPFGGGFGSGSTGDLLGGSGSSMAPQVPIPPAIAADIGNAPKNHDSQQTLMSDVNVVISYQKVYKAQELAVLLFVTNKSTQQLGNVSVQYDPPSALAVTYGGSPQPNVLGNKVTLSPLAAQQSTVLTIKLQFKGQHAQNHDLVGKLSYADGQGINKFLDFKVQISMSDLLRPTKMSTDQFGAAWGSTSGERKGPVLPTSVNSPLEFTTRAKNRLNLFPIQTIGNEVIASGTLISTGDVVLVHAKCDPTSLTLTLRSKVKPLSDTLFVHAQNVLR